MKLSKVKAIVFLLLGFLFIDVASVILFFFVQDLGELLIGSYHKRIIGELFLFFSLIVTGILALNVGFDDFYNGEIK